MSGDEGEYDVVVWVVMWKGEYVSKGLLTPLSQFFTNGALVDPDYDIDDIADAYLQNGGVVGGKKGYLPGKSGALYGIPFGAETSILAYRKDVFEENGYEPPTTYDELRTLMPKIQEETGHGRDDLARRDRAPGHGRLAAAPRPARRQDLRRSVEPADQQPRGGRGGPDHARDHPDRPDRHPVLRLLRGERRVPAGRRRDVPRHAEDRLDVARREALDDRRQRRLRAAPDRCDCLSRLGDRRLRDGHPGELAEPAGGVPVHPVHDEQDGGPAHGRARRRPRSACPR